MSSGEVRFSRKPGNKADKSPQSSKENLWKAIFSVETWIGPNGKILQERKIFPNFFSGQG